jgi:uncharacterized membrane protein
MAASASVPSSREFTFVGVAYGIYVMGLFLVWPLLAGVVLAYIKRGDVAGTMLASHYRWLIHTFWWWTVWWIVIVAGMLSVIVPNALLLAEVARSGEYLNIPWSIIGAAILGGIALSVVWFWAVYRLVRGVLRLSDGRAVP